MNPSNVPSLSLRAGGEHTIAIPQIGFGLWQVPDADAPAAIAAAFEAGYRHLDTARIYENEDGVGRALAATSLARDEIFVTTKVWNDDHLQVPKAFDASMAKLGLDVVDLYLVHWPVPAADTFVAAWESVLDLRESGRARAVGVCNFHIHHLEAAKAATGEYPAINQIELHPYLQQNELRAFCAENDIVVESWSPLASGKQVLDDATLAAIAARHGVSVAQVIIRWHLQLGLVVLPKSVTPSRIASNIEVFDFELSADDMAEIATLDRGFRTGPNPDEFNFMAAR